MNDFITNIFIKIAKKLGLTLQEKKVDVNDFDNCSSLSITAMLADRLATITLTDSTIGVNGSSERAKYLNDFAIKFWNESIKSACVFSLGTGDCLLKPNTDGKHIAVDIVQNKDFSITENIGSFIYGVLIKCDEIKKGKAVYQRVEYHRLHEDKDGNAVNYHIYQMAYKDGVEIPISAVDEWADIPSEIIIPNVDFLMFGRIKCPTLNRDNVNSQDGVPVTYGLDDVVRNAKESYQRFNQEYSDKETMIFARKSMLQVDKNGDKYIPKGKNNLFIKFPGTNVDDNAIDTYSPDIRDSSLDNGIERNFRMLEMGVGIGEGVLSKSTLTYANVDEVRASRSATYAFITEFRKHIDQGTEDLIKAVNVLCNANNITQIGDYEYFSDWSDSYISTTVERFNELMQGVNMDVVDKAELRAWIMSEDLHESEKKIKEIEKNNPSVQEIVVDENSEEYREEGEKEGKKEGNKEG